jgi:hypothetical protein
MDLIENDNLFKTLSLNVVNVGKVIKDINK